MRRLLLATTNTGKIREIRHLLDGIDVQLVGLDEFPEIASPEETGRTFAENARLKAVYYSKASGLTAIAEDSGLEIDALGGAPGVESARYGGVKASYPDKFTLLYDAMAKSGSSDRTARFVCAVAVADGDAILFETRGTVEGRIADAPAGDGGFGYDPIFFYPPFGKTLAEASEQKSTVSHRGEAFRNVRRYLMDSDGFSSRR